MESRLKKINNLFDKMIFNMISILKMSKNIRIFNFCFVNKIKNIKTINALEKSRFIVQAYNNHD